MKNIMKNISKRGIICRSIGIVLSILLAVFLNWFCTPAKTFKSEGLWWYLILIGNLTTMIIAFCEYVSEDRSYICSKIFSCLTGLIFVVALVLMLFSVN